jgi:pSer/pThr/pTyr-binding forkhead associated (FHA) protein
MAELILLMKGRVLKSIPIRKPEVTIGRDPTCDVVIDNAGVSRVHARLTMTSSGFEVADAGSANGTYVNGYRVQSQALRDRDEIQLSKFTLRFLEKRGAPVVLTPESKAALAEQGDTAPHNPLGTVALSVEEISSLMAPAAGGRPAGRARTALDRADSDDRPKTSRRATILSVTLLIVLAGCLVAAFFLLTQR